MSRCALLSFALAVLAVGCGKDPADEPKAGRTFVVGAAPPAAPAKAPATAPTSSPNVTVTAEPSKPSDPAAPKPAASKDVVKLAGGDGDGFVPVADTEANLADYAAAAARRDLAAMRRHLQAETVRRTPTGTEAEVLALGPAVCRVKLRAGPHAGKEGFVAAAAIPPPAPPPAAAPKPKDRPVREADYRPKVGETVALRRPGEGILVAPTIAAFDQFTDAEAAKDYDAPARIEESGLAFRVPDRTAAEVIEVGTGWVRVRVLAGERKGAEVYVAAERVAAR